MKAERHVYRLDCGDIHCGRKGLAEGTQVTCPLHEQARIAGPGISLFRFLNPGYAPERAAPAVIPPRPAPGSLDGIPAQRRSS